MSVGLDPRARSFLRYLHSIGWPTLAERTPQQARKDVRLLSATSSRWFPAASVRDALATGGQVDVRVRVYKPLTRSRTPRPLLIWFHGGGFVVGDLFTADGICRVLAHHSGAVVVSVDYRLAPEWPLPAAHEDAVTAANWAIRHAHELGADPARVVVGGDSAGGSLAAHVALQLRDFGPREAALQVLAYPATDYTLSHADRAPEFAKLLTWESIDWFAGHSLTGVDRTDPRISPYFADLSGLPPACIITAGIDPLRSDALAYADRLERAGVAVEHRDYPGQLHGFLDMDLLYPSARQALRHMGRRIARVQAVAGPATAPSDSRIQWRPTPQAWIGATLALCERTPPVSAARIAATLGAHHFKRRVIRPARTSR